MKYLSFVPGEYFGGCEDYAIRIAKAAAQRGWAVHLIVANTAVFEKAAEALSSSSVILLVSPFGPEINGPRSFKSLLRLAKLKWEYRKLLTEIKPSIIHAILPWHYHSIFFLETCCQLGLPVLATYQLVAPNRAPHWRQQRVIAKLCRSGLLNLSAISSNNRKLLSAYYQVEESNIPVISNRPRPASIAISKASPEAAAIRHQLLLDLDIPQKSIISLTVASLHYQKGIDILLKAASFLKQFSNLYFLIAGDGDERERLEEAARNLNVYKNVRFLGRRNDVDYLLSASDFFLFPTRYEGESFALMEAARSLLPIIASNASGIPEIFRADIDALLFEAEDPVGLSEQVARFIYDQNLAKTIADNALFRVKNFSEDDMIDATLALLEQRAKG